MTMYRTFHLNNDLDRLYFKRKDGGRVFISMEHCVRAEENNLGFYVVNSTKMLIKGVCAVGTIETEGVISKMDFKKTKDTGN